MKKTITFMLVLLMAGAAMSQGSFTCGEQISDVEGNTYETVEIGGLCWTNENMKSKTYADGSAIAKAMIYSSSMYPDTNANLATYGRLYTWFSAVNVPEGSSSKPTRNADGFVQGICPDGWHIPTVGEMNKLNTNSTESLRSVELWLQPNNNTNSTGFSSLPAGYYSNTTNRFEVLLGYTYYWSDSSSTPEFAIACDVNYYCDVAKNEQKTTGDGVSVRCVKDYSLSANTFTCGTDKVTDVEGHDYNTVLIGDQCWMRENLRTTKYADGTAIDAGGGKDPSDTEPYYYDYTGTNIPLEQRGYLYNWAAVMNGAESSNTVPSGVQGICPTGWHVPSNTEWTQLVDYVSSIPEYCCDGNSDNIAKALASTTGWESSNVTCVVGNDQDANNATGFSAVPAGYFYYSFNSAGTNANFWSSTQAQFIYNVQRIGLNNEEANVIRKNYGKRLGFSVRCVKDGLPSVTTEAVSSITATTATCGGEVTADAGTAVTARGVCWSISQRPTVHDNHTIDGSNTGSFTSNITGLTASTTYYVRAYATNSAGTAYGNEVSFTTVVIDDKSCPEAETVTDHEGNMYATVKIGNQCWMRDNLRATTSPSTKTYLIPAVGTKYTYTGKQACWYDNDSAQYAPMKYGLLYNWNAAVDTFNTAQEFGEVSVNDDESNAVSVTFTGHRKGICPTGWHLPSDAEWDILTNYVSSIPEYRCNGNSENIAKALASTTGWKSHDKDCAVGKEHANNNTTGFSAVPVGYCIGSSSFGGGSFASFWSSTQNDTGDAWLRELYNDGVSVYKKSNYKFYGFSVRCVKD